jgi:hypothetical protein
LKKQGCFLNRSAIKRPDGLGTDAGWSNPAHEKPCRFSEDMAMRKVGLGLICIAVACVLPATQVAGTETSLNRAVSKQSFETFLPPLDNRAPWLNLNRRTKLPKGDYPLGRDADSLGPLVLQAPHLQQADLAEFALGGS